MWREKIELIRRGNDNVFMLTILPIRLERFVEELCNSRTNWFN